MPASHAASHGGSIRWPACKPVHTVDGIGQGTAGSVVRNAYSPSTLRRSVLPDPTRPQVRGEGGRTAADPREWGESRRLQS